MSDSKSSPPELPAGWKWQEGQCGATHGDSGVALDGESVCFVRTYPGGFAAISFPRDVIIAIFKANGVTL